jgi:hypothetical protein
VTRPNHARAPKGAAGVSRNRRRDGARRPEWVRPYRRAQRALDTSVGLIGSCLNAVDHARLSIDRRPVGTARKLDGAARRLGTAKSRLVAASRELEAMSQCLERAPDLAAGDAPELVALASERLQTAVTYLKYVTSEVALLQVVAVSGLACGELTPERPEDRRLRIVLAPRPVPVRAFLRRRQPRLVDRIAPILRRRRRSPRPAAIRVPRRTSQGRAPPLSPICLP